MTSRTLIVARMDAADQAAVAEAFADSDAGELPHLVGVTRRELFHFHGLYFHLIETADEIARPLAAVHEHPDFVGLSDRLAKHITAYDPQTWRSPRDAMARSFYTWQAGPPPTPRPSTDKGAGS